MTGPPPPFPPPPFPPARAFAGAGGLDRAALALSPAGDGDLPFLRDLYASTRADEVAAAGWPPALATSFLAGQFDLQHRHYLAVHPDADFLVVGRAGRPVGRLTLDRSRSRWLLVDLALLPEERGTGIGTALLRWLQRSARRAGATGVELHVLHANDRARRLYARLGFVDAPSAVPTHRRMVWDAS